MNSGLKMLCELQMYRRRAELHNLSAYFREKNQIDKVGTIGYVLGVSTEADSDGSTPVCIFELSDGRLITVYVECVKFLEFPEEEKNVRDLSTESVQS
jgi:hypothetical protein